MFTGSVSGSFQFTYTVSDGPSTTMGVIRVDVVPDDSTAVPVAEDGFGGVAQRWRVADRAAGE